MSEETKNLLQADLAKKIEGAIIACGARTRDEIESVITDSLEKAFQVLIEVDVCPCDDNRVICTLSSRILWNHQ